jgi:hypothetical protein
MRANGVEYAADVVRWGNAAEVVRRGNVQTKVIAFAALAACSSGNLPAASDVGDT